MASVPLPNSKVPTKPAVVEPAPASTASPAEPPKVTAEKPPRRGLSRWWLLLVLCGIGVYFLPELVARTSLRQQIPRTLFPKWTGSIELGETSLGWFAPMHIQGVSLTDREGKTLATVERLRSAKSLWQMITNPGDLGDFHFEKSVVHLQLRGGRSNWETPLAELAGDGDSSSTSQWALQFPDLQLLVTSEDGALEQTVQGLDLKVRMEASAALTVAASFPVEAGQTDAALAVTATTIPGALPTVNLTARDFDLTRLDGLTQLWFPMGVVRGRVTGTLAATAAEAAGTSWMVESDLQGNRVTAAGWPIFAGDVLTLDGALIKGKLVLSADAVECQNVRVQTDFAKLTAQGTCRWPSAGSATPTADVALQAFGDDFLLTASVDAAKAGQRLPNALRLKSGVAMTAGQIQATLQTAKDDKGRALDGHLRLADLAATIDGQTRRWTAPLDAQVLLRPSSDGVLCDRISLRSEFCTITGNGSLADAKFRITADLDRLWQEIAPLVDLRGASLAGTARLDGSITRNENGAVTLHLEGQGDGLRYGTAQQPQWSEPQLVVTADVTGAGPVTVPWTTLTAAGFTLKSGDDQCEAKLLNPVEWGKTDAVIPLSLSVMGDWTRWQTRLRPIWSDPTMALAGAGRLTATVNYSPSRIEICTASLQSQPLQVTLPDWQVIDPAFAATLQGTWDAKSRTWVTPRSHFQGEWGQATWTDGSYTAGNVVGQPAGRLDLDVNVGRVSRWQRGDVRQHLLGQLTGRIDLRPAGDTLQGDVDMRLNNAVIAGLTAEPQARWTALWREPELSVKGVVRHRVDSTPWDISSLQLLASGLTVATNGRIDPRADGTELDLKGQLTYDWEQLMSRLDPSWAQRIQLSGRGDRPFFVKGTIRPAADGSVSIADLSGEGQLTWQQASVYGLPLSASDLSARFAQGQGQLGPLDLNVAQGRVHLAPRLDFRQNALLVLPVGRVVDQVQLTPAICQQLLKYALPVAADAAEMDGAFSLDVDENVWPLAMPQAGKARGSLTIHRARIVPGPMANRLVGTVEQVRALLERRTPTATDPARLVMELPEQTVGLAQMNGRVFHDRMTVRIGDIELVTGGSVGFDETLQLTFLLPVQEKWVRGTPALARMAGQSLRIPVTGTFSQPHIDPSILAQLAQQAAGSTIEKAIDDTVQKQLDRFLPRRN